MQRTAKTETSTHQFQLIIRKASSPRDRIERRRRRSPLPTRPPAKGDQSSRRSRAAIPGRPATHPRPPGRPPGALSAFLNRNLAGGYFGQTFREAQVASGIAALRRSLRCEPQQRPLTSSRKETPRREDAKTRETSPAAQRRMEGKPICWKSIGQSGRRRLPCFG